MDGISNVAAIVGLVQAGIQATAALNRYVSRVKKAESARARLLQHIKFISVVEKAIKLTVENASPSLRTPDLQAAIDEWFEDSSNPNRCRMQLEELTAWLEIQVESNENSKYKKLLKRMTWPAKEDKIEQTIKAFDGYMPYFNAILLLLNHNISLNEAAASKNVEHSATKSELLSWFDGIDCTNKHESTLRKRQKTTCDWLLKEGLYNSWRMGSTKFIWLHGKPGAGKSVLASAIVDNLVNSLADDETLVYFYCDFRNMRCTSAMEVLRSLTKQLLWSSKKDWLPSFSDLTTRKERGAGPPTELSILSDLLKRAAALHERPIMVVDALDECEDLSHLLDVLAELVHGDYSLFVTSRTLHAIKEAFVNQSTIPLDNRVDEMRSDIDFYVKVELESRSRLKVLAQDLKDEIQGILMDKVGGMFRWVECQLDRLNGCFSLGDIREVLDTLPETLHETYDQMLRTIDKKPFGPRIARRALMWLVMALRPLELPELADALAIRSDEPAWDATRAPLDKQVILEILGSFVTINEEVATNERHEFVSLSHYSVKEYLTSDTLSNSPYFVHLPDASLDLAKASIFSFILLKDGTNELSSYADDHGLQHLADCDSVHNETLVNHLLTFQDRISTHPSHPGYKSIRDSFYNAWMMKVQQVALYIILRYAHPSMLRHYLDHHPVRATPEDNPLGFAAWYSDVACVQLLLEKGFDANLEGPVYDGRDVHKMTPLTAAVRRKTRESQESLVQFLLENGCAVSGDAIHVIFACGVYTPCDPAVVRLLHSHGANPKLLVAGNNSSLHLLFESRGISPEDRLQIAQMLVDVGCSPALLNDQGRSTLHLAIRSLSFESIKWLISYGLPVPVDSLLHLPPYHFNIANLHLILRFLVENGALPHAQDKFGANALHLYCGSTNFRSSESFECTFRLLVELGCNINCRNNRGETPFHVAFPCRYPSRAVDLFISQGAEIPIDIVNYAVFRHWEGRNEHEVIAALTSLKRFGASFRSRTRHGDTALHCLLKSSSLDPPECILTIASFLIESGCDIHATSYDQTSVELAIQNGQFSAAEALLTHMTARSDSERIRLFNNDPQGNSILHRLCYWSSEKFLHQIKFLREVGYDVTKDINCRNDGGLTPLCVALMYHTDPGTVTALLDLGASFYYVNFIYLDSLGWASSLPWYRDADDARTRYLLRSETTFDDVILVQRLLQTAYRGRRGLSPVVVGLILDMAEYWACMKVVKQSIRWKIGHEELIAFPTVPREVTGWIPRRVVLACKASISEFTDDRWTDKAWLDFHVTRNDTKFGVPSSLDPFCNSSKSPKTDFGVWGESDPAIQADTEEQVMVGELLPGDTLSVQLVNGYNDDDDESLMLEFLQMDVYYSMKPLTDDECG